MLEPYPGHCFSRRASDGARLKHRPGCCSPSWIGASSPSWWWHGATGGPTCTASRWCRTFAGRGSPAAWPTRRISTFAGWAHSASRHWSLTRKRKPPPCRAASATSTTRGDLAVRPEPPAGFGEADRRCLNEVRAAPRAVYLRTALPLQEGKPARIKSRCSSPTTGFRSSRGLTSRTTTGDVRSGKPA